MFTSGLLPLLSFLLLLLPLAAAADSRSLYLYHNSPHTLFSLPLHTSFSLNSFNTTARLLPVPAALNSTWTLLSPFLLGGAPGEQLSAYKISAASLEPVDLSIRGSAVPTAHNGTAGFVDGDDDDSNMFLLGGEVDGVHTSVLQRISPNGDASVEDHVQLWVSPAAGFTLTPLEGRRVVFIGGSTGRKMVAMASVGVFDVATKEWRVQSVQGGEKVENRSGHTAVRHGTSVFVYGGRRGDGSFASPRLAVLDTDSWGWSVPQEQGQGAMSGHAAVMLEGGVMLVVGKEVGLFETATGRWVSAYSAPGERELEKDEALKRKVGVGVGVGVAVSSAVALAVAGRIWWARRRKPRGKKVDDSSDDDVENSPQSSPSQQQPPASAASLPPITLLPPPLNKAASGQEEEGGQAAEPLTRTASAPVLCLKEPLLVQQRRASFPNSRKRMRVSEDGEASGIEVSVRTVHPGRVKVVEVSSASSASSSSTRSVAWIVEEDEEEKEDEEDEEKENEERGYETADEAGMTAGNGVMARG